MKALDKVLAAIGEGNYNKAGDGYSCRCPAHDDNSPSLTITPKPGKVLLHCHAGCTFEQIVSALGLQKIDTFDEETAAIGPSKKQKKRHATCDDAIAAVRWSVEQDGKEVVDVIPYPYVGGNSKPFGYSVRFNFADGSKTFRQVHVDGDAWLSGAGDQLWPLYLLDEIPDDGVIYVHDAGSPFNEIVSPGNVALVAHYRIDDDLARRGLSNFFPNTVGPVRDRPQEEQNLVLEARLFNGSSHSASRFINNGVLDTRFAESFAYSFFLCGATGYNRVDSVTAPTPTTTTEPPVVDDVEEVPEVPEEEIEVFKMGNLNIEN